MKKIKLNFCHLFQSKKRNASSPDHATFIQIQGTLVLALVEHIAANTGH